MRPIVFIPFGTDLVEGDLAAQVSKCISPAHLGNGPEARPRRPTRLSVLILRVMPPMASFA